MAERLQAQASAHGFSVTIGAEEDRQAEINHWMSYAFANIAHHTPATMMITHLDDPYKVKLVSGELASGVDVGIALSSHTCDLLIAAGVPEQSLAFVVPGHDFVATPRRIVIGITSRLYPDGRKREQMLVALARTMSLTAFRFEIFGAGWEDVVPTLESAGAEVSYFPGTTDYEEDYRELVRYLPRFDYYLYIGRDEGSLGTLDALAAGVRTIVTPQGFHVDLEGGITHPVWSQADLEQVFRTIAEEVRSRPSAVSAITWDAYARAHAVIWTAILDGRRAEINSELAELRGQSRRAVEPRGEHGLTMFGRVFSPYRLRSALSHVAFFRPVRTWLKSRSRAMKR